MDYNKQLIFEYEVYNYTRNLSVQVRVVISELRENFSSDTQRDDRDYTFNNFLKCSGSQQ